MRSECEEAEGSGRHRAGSGWGIQQRQACLRDRMQSSMGLLPTVKAPPSRKSLFSRVLHFSTVSPSSSSSLQGLALRHSPYSTVSIQFE